MIYSDRWMDIIWSYECQRIRDSNVIMWLSETSDNEIDYMTIKEDVHALSYVFWQGESDMKYKIDKSDEIICIIC